MESSNTDQVIFLGTGTSYGVPMVGCRCAVCRSDDVRDKRSRCSALFEVSGRKILVDTTPDFRTQALREGIDHLDGVIITHVHADHAFGLDDLRPLSMHGDGPLLIHANRDACRELRRLFPYIFAHERRREGFPWLALVEITPGVSFEIAGVPFVCAEAPHGPGRTLLVRQGDFAWITDLKRLPAEARAVLDGVDKVALDMLREEPHPTHLCLAESLEIWNDLGRPETWCIHMSHEVSHAALDATLPPGVRLAWDGLRIPFC